MQAITLLVEDNDELAKFYRLNLKVWVGAEVCRAANIKEVEVFLQKNKNIDLIISKAAFTPIVKKLLDADNTREISHIDIGSKNFDGETIENGLEIKPLLQASAKALGVTAKDMAKMVVPDYFPLDLLYFASIKQPICSIYSCNEGSYEVVFKADEDIDRQKLVELKQGGHESLFVEKNDRLKLVTNLTQEIVTKIKPEALNPAEVLSASEMTQQLLQFKLRRIGITPETADLAKANIKNMVAASRKFPKLGKLMARLLKNKSSYLYKHSQVLMFVCSHLMDHIDWGNEEQKKTINFVAFFHDIALENEEQAQIHTEAQLKQSKISKQEKELVHKHAQIAAELVVKFPHAPMGADTIIRQHHGITHGVGFSDSYGGNLSPMSVVFILAEDFVDHLINSGTDLNIDSKIKQMRARYSTQRFQKIIDILETVAL